MKNIAKKRFMGGKLSEAIKKRRLLSLKYCNDHWIELFSIVSEVGDFVNQD